MTSITDINTLAKKAMETLAKNQETLIAQFIIQNPDVKAEDIELVQQNNYTEITWSIRRKSKARPS